MRKIVVAACLLCGLLGCTARNWGRIAWITSSSLRYSLEAHDGWELITFPPCDWKKSGSIYSNAPEPKYFSMTTLMQWLSKAHLDNQFYAKYHLPDGSDLVVWIRLRSAPYILKQFFVVTASLRDEDPPAYRNVSAAAFPNFIFLTLSPAEVDVTQAEVQLLQNGKPFYSTADISPRFPQEKQIRPGRLFSWEKTPDGDYWYIGDAISNAGGYFVGNDDYIGGLPKPRAKILEMDELYAEMYPRFKEKNFVYQSLVFGVTMRSADYEGLTLVLDNLYWHGEKLPPLKVRLNYYEPDKIPGLEGKYPRDPYFICQ